MRPLLYIFLAVLLLFVHFLCTFMDLDEAAILKDTRAAFAAESYKPLIIEKTVQINQFAEFLIQHGDTLLTYALNQVPFRTAEGRTYEGRKERGSFCYPIGDKAMIQYFVPPMLKDSFDYFCTSINPVIFPLVTLHPKNDFSSLFKAKGNIVFQITIEKPEPFNPNYYHYQWLSYNRRETQSLSITTIDEMLQKDTFLNEHLKYVIRILPYAGI